MAKPVGVGALFQDDAHKTWMTLTGSRYNAMMKRLVKKKLIEEKRPPFTCDQYRRHILAMIGREDGFIQCRYCRSYFGIKDIASDHAMPLDRGGSFELDNLEFPCRDCNMRKGKMTPDEFLKLLAFLETIPLARIDILHRLQMSVQLAAGQRSIAPVVNDLKQSGAWEKAQALRRQAKRDKTAGLGAF